MLIIGRKQEQDELRRYSESDRPEFVVVYGRRRVGKTYLVKEFFNNEFSFFATGVLEGDMSVQLRSFGGSLREHGDDTPSMPSDWFEAFERLKALLQRDDVARDAASGKKVVFLDELPWFDTPRSNFRQALDLFWNGWASSQPQVMLLVCGSATSWIVGNLLQSRGGFHNRLTGRIPVEPFTLSECDEYFTVKGMASSREQVVMSYMAFGGVPYYLDLLDRRLSVAQNIDNLCFAKRGALRHEFDELYRSLFSNAERHLSVVRALASRKGGLTRKEIEAKTSIAGGGTLTKTLSELEQCGFVRKYHDFTRRENSAYYQLVDPFTLFYLTFMDKLSTDAAGTWLEGIGTPRRNAWAGHAFELVCLWHVAQMKSALGVSGISADVCAWRSRDSDPGAQIDLLISRGDGVVNVCEMKYSDGQFAIDKAYDQSLRNKLATFASETGTKKALQLTMVTMNGVLRNKYWGTVQREITADDLFS